MYVQKLTSLWELALKLKIQLHTLHMYIKSAILLHQLILKITISDAESCPSLLSFAHSPPIIEVDEIELGKLLNPA